MDQAFRAAAGIADPTPDPHADPSRDVELAPSNPRLTKNPSRASLPLSHRRSFSTIGRSRPASAAGANSAYIDGAQDDATDAGPPEDDELPWGPEHPCYPHSNPHVPISSPSYKSTRIIRIPRDWMSHGDLAPAFLNVYPEILETWLSEEHFRLLITKLNTSLAEAFIPTTTRNWVDSAMGLLTGWIWDDIGATGMKKKSRALESWPEEWNRDVGAMDGVAVIPLRRTAYLCLDIQIPDPQITDAEGLSMIGGGAGGGEASTNRESSIGRPGSRVVRGSGASGSGSGSARRKRHSELRDDVEYGPYPVPPIPDRYLEETSRQGWDSSLGRGRERGEHGDGGGGGNGLGGVEGVGSER